MKNDQNAPKLREHGATDVVIHHGPHVSQSEHGNRNTSYNAYNAGGNLVQGAHAPGRMFTPTDQAYIQRWGHISQTNPSAGGQQDRHVDMSRPPPPPPPRGRGRGRGAPY
ncbi:hypothetical protein K474DRAFT_1710632 [Panus rudis PR-1116 ss-1]|nr:hypothetical protein K474DRAFT_1710632 [Panus rudis PR-1116 ss-1]